MLVESRAVRAIRERWQQDLKRYAEQREEFLLY
jgi:uncharacterized protein YbbC (DUF1343 family)